MLIILTSHPIQYQVPLWRALDQAGVALEVWYLCDQGVRETPDAEFKTSFAWDLPMLEGYKHRFLNIPGWNLRKPTTMRLRESFQPLFAETGATHLWVEGWRFPAFWQAVLQAKRSGLKVLCRGESNDLAPEPPAAKRWVKKALLGWFFRQVDAFLCIGSANRRLYQKYGVTPDRLKSAPYCVDNGRFRAQAAEMRDRRSEIRAEWNIAEDAFCVLFAGKLIPKKRPLDIIAALEHLSRDSSVPSVHLLVVGTGELEQQVRSRCAIPFDYRGTNSSSAAGVPASFAGFLNQRDIAKAYVAADCLVLPSESGETWGLVVNEAMACGLPCIVSDACGCAEDLIVPVDPLLRYHCGQIDGLAESLARIVSVSPSSAIVNGVVERHNLCHTVTTVTALLSAIDQQREHAATL